MPAIPSQGGAYVLSLVGGIGGSIAMLSYNYWMREEGMSGPSYLGYVRGDVGVAYLFTAIFGMSIMLIANRAFFLPGVPITNAQAVPKMAEMLGIILGTFGYYAYSIGFWAAVFASLLGVWHSVPYLYADVYGIFTGVDAEGREELTKVTSTTYRIALVFITLVPLPLAFTGSPIQVIVIYTAADRLACLEVAQAGGAGGARPATGVQSRAAGRRDRVAAPDRAETHTARRYRAAPAGPEDGRPGPMCARLSARAGVARDRIGGLQPHSRGCERLRPGPGPSPRPSP